MKPVRHLIPLAVVAAVAASAWAWWQGDAAAPPEAPAAQPASAPVSLAQVWPTAPPPVAVASSAAVAALPPAPAPSAPVRRAAPDLSYMQRAIQMAVSGDQPGKARQAAQYIQMCESLERIDKRMRDGMVPQRPQISEERQRQLAAGRQQMLASCQAVDEASRAQLVPLLRRSLAEGDKGAAASLVRVLGTGTFDMATEPAVVAALRRDAWTCDRSSQSVLQLLTRRNPQLLTPNEVGALREQQRTFLSANALLQKLPVGDADRAQVLDRMQASLKPPPEADPAEVARMAAEIASHCEAGR